MKDVTQVMQGDHTYRIMSGVVGFIHPSTGKQCMLEINQAMHAPKAEDNLLSPMQC